MQNLLKFGIVGTLGFVVDAGVLMFLIEWLQLNVFVARILSFIVAVFTTWLVNRNFTFRDPRRARRSTHEEYVRYFSVQTCGAAINLLVFFFAIRMIPVLESIPVIPLAIGSIVALVFNYLAARHFVFSAAPRL
jgi:putative flippase GtrA